jgi:hypothetical protein
VCVCVCVLGFVMILSVPQLKRNLRYKAIGHPFLVNWFSRITSKFYQRFVSGFKVIDLFF